MREREREILKHNDKITLGTNRLDMMNYNENRQNSNTTTENGYGRAGKLYTHTAK